MKLSKALFLMTTLVTANHAFACSPPAPLSLASEPPQIPYQDPSFFAFVGKVVGYTSTRSGDPALSLLVVDAWSDRQSAGQVITIGVAQWIGCGLSKPMGKPFKPASYPIGSRVRVISKEQTMHTWDVKAGILVLGVGT